MLFFAWFLTQEVHNNYLLNWIQILIYPRTLSTFDWSISSFFFFFLVEGMVRVLVDVLQKQISRYRLVYKKMTWKGKEAVVEEWRNEMRQGRQWNVHYQGSHCCGSLELNPAGEPLKVDAERISPSYSTQGIKLLGYLYTNSFHYLVGGDSQGKLIPKYLQKAAQLGKATFDGLRKPSGKEVQVLVAASPASTH